MRMNSFFFLLKRLDYDSKRNSFGYFEGNFGNILSNFLFQYLVTRCQPNEIEPYEKNALTHLHRTLQIIRYRGMTVP